MKIKQFGLTEIKSFSFNWIFKNGGGGGGQGGGLSEPPKPPLDPPLHQQRIH